MFKQQKQMTAYEKTTIHNNFWQTISCLEKYIEVAEYYPDWESRKQIRNDNIKTNDPSKVESMLANLLFELKTEITGKSTFFCDEIKQKFYQWLGAAKIDVNNCPKRLRHFLFEFNEILERRGAKIESDSINRKNENEDKEIFSELFSGMQIPLKDERFKYLEGKSHEDIIFKNNFDDSGKKIEQAFKKTIGQYDYQDFHFFPQRKREYHDQTTMNYFSEVIVCSADPQCWTNYQIIQDIENNSQNWRLDKIPTEIDNFGIVKKQEIVLIHKTIQTIYDQAGNLNFNNNPLYCLEKFDAQQRFKIKKALNISVDYLTDEEIKWVVREIKQNPSIWQFKIIDGQIYLIHNSAQIKKEEIGTLIHSQQKFSKTEIEEINKYLSSYQEQNHLASLIKQRKETKDKIIGDIKEVIRFKTWWSNYNVATVINCHEDCYQIFVVVYEPAQNQGKIKETLEVFEISNGYDKNSLESAKNKASNLRIELDGENPILAIIGSYGNFSVNNLINEPYVEKKEIPCKIETYNYDIPIVYPSGGYECCDWYSYETIYPNNPDEYLKPLDIVWIEKSFGTTYFHVGIYLGNNEVCHIIGTPFNKKGVRITDWSDFIKGGVGKLICYHHVIPFKHYEKIVKQIAWAVNSWWREGEYCLAGQNCEHATNMIIYGIEYSQQVAERPNLAEPFDRKYAANKNKSSSLVLENEVNRVNNQLGERDDQKAREIRVQYKAQIEISAKDGCKIM